MSQTLFSGSLSRVSEGSNNFHFPRVSNTNHFPTIRPLLFLVFWYIRNQNLIECGRVLWASSCREVSWQSSARFQVFQLRNFKIHSTIMWSPQEGPRESYEPLGIFPRNRGMFKFFIRSFPSFTHSAIAVAIAERGGVQKLCPFRSSNHGRPIVIYQSFCFADVFHIELHFTLRTQNETPRQQQQRQLVIAARNFNY